MFLCLSVLFLGWIGSGQNPHVLIQTELGDIEVEVCVDKAPITANNFLKYVDEGLFDDGSFYRVVRMDNQPNDDIKIEVVQGGIGQRRGVKRFPPIEHETTETTGVLHKDGIISMARSQPGTASSEFFICVNDQPHGPGHRPDYEVARSTRYRQKHAGSFHQRQRRIASA